MKLEKGQERKKYVGIGACKVIAINPTQEQLCALMGWESKDDDREIEYSKSEVDVKYVEDGIEKIATAKQVFIDFILEEIKTKTRHKLRFSVTDFYRRNKLGTKMQFINQHGGTCWVDDEANLPEWFTHLKYTNKKGEKIEAKREYRRARIGEENLFEFLAKWTDFSKFNLANNLFLDDMKKFWKGDTSELNPLVTIYESNTVMCMFGIKTSEVQDAEGNSELKEYQSISNRFFCQGKHMKSFRLYFNLNFEGLEKDRDLYDLNKFVKEVNDSENGFRDYFEMSEITEYIPSNNPIYSEQPLVNDSDY